MVGGATTDLEAFECSSEFLLICQPLSVQVTAGRNVGTAEKYIHLYIIH